MLRVAVTGHRDLAGADEFSLRASVDAALSALVAECRPATVELLTGMADGADQLVAEVAASVGCALHVVLPKRSAEYSTELSAEGARRLERLLIDETVSVSTISRPSGAGGPAEGDDPSAPYLRLGMYLARRANVIVALWDGSVERKPGGTFDVLVRHLDGHEAPEPSTTRAMWMSEEAVGDAEGPFAVWVETPRDSTGSDDLVVAGPTPPTDSAGLRYLSGTESPGVWRSAASMPAVLQRLLDDLGAYTTAVSDAGGTKGLEGGYPLLDPIPESIDPNRREALDEIQSAYLTADRLAMRHQARSDRSFVLAALIGAGMGFTFLWFAKIDSSSLWLYLYLLFFIAGYGLFRWARSRHWLRYHLSQRVAAETLRVRFFTTLIGVAEQVEVRRLMSLTGVSSFPGFAWAAESDRVGVPTTVEDRLGTLPAGREDHAAMEIARQQWVDDQAGYFERKVGNLKARHLRLQRVTRVLYVASALTVIGLILFGSVLKKEHITDEVSVKTALVFLMGLLPLWLGLWEIHQSRMATRELLWQFDNQAGLFNRASTQLRYVTERPARLRVFVELAERSLFETYLWTIHRFHREFEPPSAG